MLQQFSYKISCLNDIIHKIINGKDSQAGTVGIKVNKPKPAIYAMAIFDLMDTWYKFLFPGQPIEQNKYNALKSYVERMGTEEEGRAELYKLLDIVYTDPEELLADNQVAPGNNPYSFYLGTPKDTSTSTSTSSNHACDSTTDTEIIKTTTTTTITNIDGTTTTTTNTTTTTSTDISSNLNYVSCGDLTGSVMFDGNVSVYSNTLTKVTIDEFGNVTEVTTTTEKTKPTPECAKCCCHPCACCCCIEEPEPPEDTSGNITGILMNGFVS
jgi:hypothetical protein